MTKLLNFSKTCRDYRNIKVLQDNRYISTKKYCK